MRLIGYSESAVASRQRCLNRETHKWRAQCYQRKTAKPAPLKPARQPESEILRMRYGYVYHPGSIALSLLGATFHDGWRR